VPTEEAKAGITEGKPMSGCALRNMWKIFWPYAEKQILGSRTRSHLRVYG
jgi:hypothetical protein